jgi:hypothetical protein
MPPRCTVCAHPERQAIDKAIIEGESERGIVGRFGVSKGAVGRHRPHAKKKLERASLAEGRTLLSVVEELHDDAREVFDMGRLGADGELMIKAIRERRELAALEFGTKSKVETTHRPAAVSPREERAELEALKQDIEERERELAAQERGPTQ